MLDLEEHRSALTGYCQRIVGAAEADDAVQETMLRAWRAAGDFDRRCSTRAWLYRIATNTCCDLLRGRERRGRLEQRVQQFASAASPASPEDPARIAETRDAVRFALTVLLGVLPARQRAALILCEVLRWRADEAARALGTSQAAVASSLQRARATLAARDQADPPGAVDEELLARHMEAFLRYDITSLCFTEPRRTSEPANLSSRQGGEATVTVAPAAPTVAGNVRNWSARSPEHAIRWAMRVPWLWPALLTLAIGSYQLDRPLLWRDELWSWTFAADPAHVLIRSISSWNVAQLPYELLLHFWIAVAGDSVVALRLPSVLAMAASAAVVVLIARRLASPRAGLLAGL